MESQNLARLEHESVCRRNYTPIDVDDSHIYMYNGHGGDICDKKGNLVIKEVPQGCIYVTQTLCGIINRAGSIFRDFSNPKYAQIWRDPVTHVEELKQLLGNNPSVHIHLPGCTYVDNTFYPVSEVGERDKRREDREKIVLSYSGLMPLNTALGMTDKERELFSEEKYDYYGSFLNADVDSRDIIKYFSKSVYPKVTYKSSRMPVFYFKTLASGYRRSVSSLMEEFPGIHFNFLCRSIRDPQCASSIMRRRRFSAVGQDTLYNGIGRFIDVIDENGDERVAQYIEQMKDRLLENQKLEELVPLIELAKRNLYKETQRKLETIYLRIARAKFDTLLEADATSDEIKEFFDTLDSSQIQGPTGAYLLEYFFNKDNRAMIRHVCKLGAPMTDMNKAFANRRPIMNKQTKTRKRILRMVCKKARRTRNRSDSFRSNESA